MADETTAEFRIPSADEVADRDDRHRVGLSAVIIDIRSGAAKESGGSPGSFAARNITRGDRHIRTDAGGLLVIVQQEARDSTHGPLFSDIPDPGGNTERCLAIRNVPCHNGSHTDHHVIANRDVLANFRTESDPGSLTDDGPGGDGCMCHYQSLSSHNNHVAKPDQLVDSHIVFYNRVVKDTAGYYRIVSDQDSLADANASR